MKKAISILLTAEFLALQALAQTIVDSGSCGNNEGDCNWILYEGGKLSITGSGKMKNYDSQGNNASPWGKNLTSVEISGVTSLGNYAFHNNPALTSVKMSNSIERIGVQTFSDLYALKSLEIPDSVTTLDHGAFNYSHGGLVSVKLSNSLQSLPNSLFNHNYNLKTVVIPESVTQMGDGVFINSSITTLYCSEAQQSLCQTALKNAGKTDEEIASILKAYQKYGNEYYFDGKFYTKATDIGTTNRIKKRIYTIDEANKVSGRKNSIKIRYK